MPVVDQHVAWIGLGSNLNDPAGQLRLALDEMAALVDSRLLAVSSFYRTAPVGGPADQPVFCNAAAALATNLAPHALLTVLHAIEAAHNRIRDIRWGPRTLDLDILAYDRLRLAEDELSLPHPRAHERAFVLVPLAEIAPALKLGRHGRVIDCLQRVACHDIEYWATPS